MYIVSVFAPPAAPRVLLARFTHATVFVAVDEAPLSIHAYNGTFPEVPIGAPAVNSMLLRFAISFEEYVEGLKYIICWNPEVVAELC